MNIIIVDDDSLVAVSLKTIIEAGGDTKVLATGKSGEEAISLYRLHKPDILLMDIRMGGMTGLDAGKSILAEDPSAKILFLTTFNDDEYIRTALAIGAKGYIIKQDFDGILPALRAVNEGQTVFGGQVVDKLPQMLSAEKKVEEKTDFAHEDYGLTDQEAEIVKCVADGLSNREIAEKLYLSEGTVRNYISTILSKLNLRDRTNLAIFYYKHCN
jgi:DNA-binding NarL/FixJ family response regulator